MTVADRFWSHVDTTGECWLWTAKITRDGYGCFCPVRGKFVGAHRFAYETANDAIPAGMDIDHICSIRACVNPDHLRLATRSQNLQHRTGAQTNSASGVRGVHWVEAMHKWRAKVVINRKTIVVGFFTDLADAEAAVIAKRNELFTHNDLDRAGV